MGYLDTRLGSLPRTGTFVQSLGSFNTLAELNATHPANNYNPGTTAYTVDQGFMISDGSVWESPGMVPGEEDVTAATYAAARLLSGAATGARLQVRGRTSQSDGGQGLFTWVAGGSTTINDGSQLTAPGGIWQRPDTTIQAQWYGVDPTGVAASDVALNLAIQDAIIQKKKLVLPSGIFLLNAPLICFVSGSNFAKVDIEGQGMALPGTLNFPGQPLSAYEPNTILCLNSKLIPAIIFQNNRYASIRNLSIQGLNTTPFSGPSPPTDVRSDYIVSGCPTTFQSPYCSIAIDPFPASAPADGGYSGLGAYYGPAPSNGGSSGITIENVGIAEFVVGIALSTAGVSQGDKVTLRNVHAAYCETGFAGGDSQARNCIISNCGFSNMRQAFDTINYGTGAGTPANPLVIENTIFGTLYRVFALNNQSPCLVKGCYAESIKTLGQYGKNTSGTATPITFESCQWSIRGSWGSIPPLFFESPSPTTFKGNFFGNDLGNSHSDAWNIVCWNQQGGGGSFEACTFDGSSFTDLPPHISLDFNARCGAHLRDCLTLVAGALVQISDDFLRNNGIAYIANVKGRLRATWQQRYVADNNLTYNYQPATTAPAVQCNGTGGSLVITGGVLNFTETTLGEVQVNDILMWKMLAQGYSANSWIVPAWKVASIDGSGNVVANPIYDINQYDTVANTTPLMYGADRIGIVRHQWAPTTALTGNTHTSTTLDTLSQSTLINGDWVQGVGIPTNTRVVSGGGTASVVLSKAATSTLTGTTIYDGQLVGSQQQGIYFPNQAGNTGAAPVPTFALGAVQAWTLSANTTWGVPTGAWIAGNRLTLLVTANGVWTTAWNAVYRNAPAIAASANAQKATFEFMYDGTNWQFIGGSAAFA